MAVKAPFAALHRRAPAAHLAAPASAQPPRSFAPSPRYTPSHSKPITNLSGTTFTPNQIPVEARGQSDSSRRRVRMHVNPLQEVPTPNWETIFANPSSPMHFDIGFGKGLYLFRLARDNRDWNYSGIDVRLPMVQAALGMQESSASSIPQGKLQRISMLYPDPWFKKRHAKRRMLTPRLVSEMADALPAGGQVLLETDVKELADDMWHIMARPTFAEVTDPKAPFAALEIATERQASVKRFGLPHFRRLFERTDKRNDSAHEYALAARPIETPPTIKSK